MNGLIAKLDEFKPPAGAPSRPSNGEAWTTGPIANSAAPAALAGRVSYLLHP